MSLQLIKTKENFEGLKSNQEGEVILQKNHYSFENTVRFSINGINDHTNNDIVIIANPQSMTIPSGFTQKDVWFNFDNEREINIGKAKIFAPIGYEPPFNVNVTFFDSSIPNEKQRVVNEYLKSLDVTPHTFNKYGWNDMSIEEIKEWTQSTKSSLYGDESKKIQDCTYYDSYDYKIEKDINHCTDLIKQSQHKYLIQATAGHDLLLTNVIENYIDGIKETVKDFTSSMPKEQAINYAEYTNEIKMKIQDFEFDLKEVKEKYKSPYFLKLSQISPEQGPFNLEQITQKIQKLGFEDFYYVNTIKNENGYQPITTYFSSSDFEEKQTNVQTKNMSMLTKEQSLLKVQQLRMEDKNSNTLKIN